MIRQGGKPNGFDRCKLAEPQIRYTVMENEWLSIVETLKDFCTILFGQQFKIYTDHNNITRKTIQHQ